MIVATAVFVPLASLDRAEHVAPAIDALIAGDELPAELARRETRLRKIREAKKALEAERKALKAILGDENAYQLKVITAAQLPAAAAPASSAQGVSKSRRLR